MFKLSMFLIILACLVSFVSAEQITDANNITYTSEDPNNYEETGMVVTTNKNIEIISVGKHPLCQVTYFKLRDENFAVVSNVTFDGDFVTYSEPYPILNSDKTYYLMTDNNEASYTTYRVASFSGFPISGTNINWISGRYGANNYTDFAWCITNVTSQEYVDTMVPLFTTPSKNETPHINNDVSFSVTITDNSADSYRFFNNGSGSYENDSASSYTSGETVSVVKSFATSHQNYCWGFWANDTNGNSNVSVIDCFTVLNSAPQITLTSPDDNLHSNVNLSVVFTVTDADSDAVSCTLNVNGSITPVTNSSVDLGVSTTLTTIDMTDNGFYSWNVSCDDSYDIEVTANRNYILDTEPPLVNWYSPITTVYTNNPVYQLNASSYDPYLDAVNMTGYKESSIVYTNFTNESLDTEFWSVDTINMDSLGGQGNYTFELCARDSLTESPYMADYHATIIETIFNNKINFYDGESGNDITVTFEILNPAGNPVALAGRDVEMEFTEDGEHILYGGTADFNAIGEKGVLIYHSNTEIYFIEKYDKPGHFVTSDYKLYFHHQSIVDKGFTIIEQGIIDGDYVVKFQKDTIGRLNFDPITGGLNSECSTSSTIVYDITAPSVTSLQAVGLGNNVFNITVDTVDDVVSINAIMLEIEEPSASKTNYTMSNLNENIYNFTYYADEIGTHNIKVYADDTIGNMNDTVTSSFSALDIYVPVFGNQEQNETPYLNGDLRMNITITDYNASHYKFFWNDTGSYVNDSASTYTNATPVSTTKTVSTAHQNICWGYWANDTSGNSASSSITCFTVANTYPEKPTVYSPQAQFYATVDIEFSSTDYDDDSLTYYIYIDSILNQTSAINISDWDAGDGNYTLEVKAYDGFNYSEASDSVLFAKDTTSPLVHSSQGVDLSGNVFNISVNVTDTGSGVNSVVVQVTTPSTSVDNYSMSVSGIDIYAYQYSAVEVGLYTYIIYANDTLGNTDDSETGNFTSSDIYPPSASPISAVYLGSNYFNITADVSDADSSVDTVIVEVTDPSSNINNYTMSNLHDNIYNYTYLATDEGEHFYIIYANDSYGNMNISEQDGFSGYDVYPPLVTSQQAVDLGGNLFNISVDVQDIHTLIDNVTIEIEEPSSAKTNYTMSNLNDDIYNLTYQTDEIGTHNYRIYALDAQGNMNDTVTGSFSSTDFINPIVHSQQSVNLNSDGVTWNISVNATDNVGIVEIKIEIEIPSLVKTNYSMSGDEIYHYVYTALEYGTHNYRIYASDAQGNTNDTVTGYFNAFDAVAPQFTGQSKNTTPYLNGDVELTITILDDSADSYKFFWNDTGSYVNDSASTYTNATPVSTTKTVSTVHQNICWGYWANDTNGNSAVSSVDCFTVANTAPSTPIIYSPQDSQSYVTVDIEFSATDYDNDSLTYEVYINASLNITTSNNVSDWSASDGTYSLYVCADDSYNSTCSSSVSFTKDSTGPDITVLTIVNGVTYNYVPLWINFTTDENADSCILNNSYWVLNDSTSTFFAYSNDNDTPNSYYVIDITCNDTLGNINTETIYFTLDTEAPMIYSYSIQKDNSTSLYTYGSFVVNVTVQDNILVTSYVANITRQSDSLLMWNYSNGAINLTTYDIIDAIDVSSWENTTYVYDNTVCNHVQCVHEIYQFEFIHPYPPVITVYSPVPVDVDGAIGETVLFDIEVEDNNTEDFIIYDWQVDLVSLGSDEDFDYTISSGYIGLVYNVLVTATDDSPFLLSDSETWNITITSGHHTTYALSDFTALVVDGMGTAGISFIEWIDIFVILGVLSLIIVGGIIYLRGR